MLALSHKPSFKNLSLLFLVAFALRAATFFFYIQHEERYRQADSNDYHTTALSVGLGHGMIKLHNGQPSILAHTRICRLFSAILQTFWNHKRSL